MGVNNYRDMHAKLLTDLIEEGILLVDKPNVSWSVVIGLETVIDSLRHYVQLFHSSQPMPPSDNCQTGILLFGPSGTGKTLITRALATELSNATLITVFLSKIVSKIYNDPKRIVRNVFKLAKQQTHCIMLMKDIDVLVPPAETHNLQSLLLVRQEVIEQMQMFRSNSKSFFIGMTNTPWILDQEILHWFNKMFYIPLPGKYARIALFEYMLRHTYNSMLHQDFSFIADKTDGLSGQQISHIVHETLLEQIRISQEATHFRRILLDPAAYGIMHLWTPSSPNYYLAEEISNADVPKGRVYVPPVASSNILRTLRKLQLRMTDTQKILQHEDFFLRIFGQS